MELLPAIIGGGSAVLGSAVSGIIYHRVMKKREEEETKRRRAEAYVDEKRERLIELNEAILDAEGSLDLISTSLLTLEKIESTIDDTDTKIDKKMEEIKSCDEEIDNLIEDMKRLREAKAYASAFLSDEEEKRIEMAENSLSWFVIQCRKELDEEAELSDEELKEVATREVDRELEGMEDSVKQELSKEELRELRSEIADRTVEQVTQFVDELIDKSDQAIYESTTEELEESLRKMMKSNLIPVPSNLKESEKMVSHHLMLARKEVEDALSEPVEYFRPS